MEFLIKFSTILEREIEFLKTEIFTKNRTFNKTLSNNTYKNNNDNNVGETWDFDNAFNISDCQSVCNADKICLSNLVMHVSLPQPFKEEHEDQLKTIREEKHKENLHNVSLKTLSLVNGRKK